MSSYTHPSIPSDYDVEDAFSSTNAPNYTPTSPDYSRDFFPPEDISPPKDTETPVESPIPVSPSSSVGSSSPVRSTTPPPDYPFDESIFAELDSSLWIISRPLGSEPVPEKPDESDTCYNGFAAALAVLVTGASQSRQHESHHRFFPVDTSLIHIESRKSPTKSLFDVGSRRISIFTVNTKEYHSDVLAIITRIMRRT
ncbi:hypothetical protein Tco_0741675 [Tanacetum coccineum]